MALTLSVTPGLTWVTGSLVTPANLNLTANPLVRIPDGSITTDLIDIDQFITALRPALVAINYLPWGSFHWDQFKPGLTTCPVGLKTEPVAGWHVNPTGADVKASRMEGAPDTQSGHSLRVEFLAAPVTLLQIGTYLPPQVTTMAQGDLVFSIWIHNAGAASFTPRLLVYTSTADGDEAAVIGAADVAGSAPCPPGAWTRVSWVLNAFELDPYMWRKGAHVCVQIPTGILTAGGQYVRVAQAAIDKLTLSTAWIPNLAELNPFPPGFQLPWPGEITTIPQGWLPCDGTAVSKATYRKLYDVIGDRYNVTSGPDVPAANQFNLPDLRGTVPFGAEEPGGGQDRAQISIGSCSVPTGALNLIDFSSPDDTAKLRAGMGVFHANFPAGAVIEGVVSSTRVKVSVSATAAIGLAAIRFSKIGPADPQVVGAAGSAVATPEKVITVSHASGCVTTNDANAHILVVPNLAGLACGMVIDIPGAGLPAGTTIAAFRTVTSLRMSASATLPVSGPGKFYVNAPESEQEATYQYLLRNPTVHCIISSGTDNNPQTGTTAASPINFLLRPGMRATGPAGFGTGTYVISLGADGMHFSIPNLSSASVSNYEVNFSAGGALVSAGEAPPGPRWLAQNWMIKT